jgi:hypothetical protein
MVIQSLGFMFTKPEPIAKYAYGYICRNHIAKVIFIIIIILILLLINYFNIQMIL